MATTTPTSELLRGLARILLASPFRKAKYWPLVVVVVRPEGKRVATRSDFAAWLRANDLHKSSLECVNRKVNPGELLVWLEVDEPALGFAGFCKLDVARLAVA